MSKTRLRTRPASNHRDVAEFFDDNAPTYTEQHGDAERLLRYRLDLLRAGARLSAEDVVLEIGCGDGLHLLALAKHYGRGIGIDLSPGMVEAARRRLEAGPWQDKVSFAVDAAESLSSVHSSSVDVVLCVGSLEHMLDQAAVLRSAFRVLRPGGRLQCLTLNGGSLWYRYLAPALKLDTRQLATDHYLDRRNLEKLVREAGFRQSQFDYWTFIQRGDMSSWLATLFAGLDQLGKHLHLDFLRGGLRAHAMRAP